MPAQPPRASCLCWASLGIIKSSQVRFLLARPTEEPSSSHWLQGQGNGFPRLAPAFVETSLWKQENARIAGHQMQHLAAIQINFSLDLYKPTMGAGENLPLNVLCEDGDISYRLFCHSVTGVNTWVSLMQTTTLLHLWTPLNPWQW